MIYKDKWYTIAESYAFPAKGEIVIILGGSSVLAVVNCDFSSAAISLKNYSIAPEISVEIRIQKDNSKHFVDLRYLTSGTDLGFVPEITAMTGGGFTTTAIAQAITSNVITVLGEITGAGQGQTGFDANQFFYFDVETGTVITKYNFASEKAISFYGNVGSVPGGGGVNFGIIDNLLSLSTVDALSARQGGVLAGLIAQKQDLIPANTFVAYRTFGSAANNNTGDFLPYRTFGTAANSNVSDFEAAGAAASYLDGHNLSFAHSDIAHSNRAELDSINQSLSKISDVRFNSIITDGPIGFYGGAGNGTAPIASLIDLSDIDSNIATAAVGSVLVKLSNGKYGAGSVSIDLSNYFNKTDSDSRFAYKSHSHDYISPTTFNSHTGDTVKHLTAAERTAWNGKEPALGNPDVDGKILASTVGGVRSWVNRYILPVAAAAMLGGVMIGSNISVTAQGVISVAAPYSHPASHAASMIDTDATRRFISDAQLSNLADAYNLRHSHTNKANLDTINQDLSKTSNVQFNNLIADGSIGFYGGVGSGSTPVASLLDLSDIDASISTAATGTPLVKLASGKWGAGSISIDLSNYYNKADSDARYAFKSHSHDYISPTTFNGHTGLTTAAHGLGASAFHADSFFVQVSPASVQNGSIGINGYIYSRGLQINDMTTKGGVFGSGATMYFTDWDTGVKGFTVNVITGAAAFYSSIAMNGALSGATSISIVGNTTGLSLQQSVDGSIFNGIDFNAYTGVSYASIKMNQATGEVRYYTSNSGYYPTFYSNGVLALSLNTSQEATFSSTIQATNATFTSLGTGYLPYKTSGAFGNSPIFTDGTTVTLYNDTNRPVFLIQDERAVATGIGGVLALGGRYRAGVQDCVTVTIAAYKENSTNQDYAYGMVFSVQPMNGGLTEALRLSSLGAATFASTISATTGIFSNLTANYLPKHTAGGLVNSLIKDDGTTVRIIHNTLPTLKFSNGSLDFGGIICDNSSGEIRIGGLYNGGYFPTFYSNNAEAARILTNGTFLVGYTSDPTSGNKLAVNGPIYAAARIESASYLKGTSVKLGTWEIKENASGELEFIQSGTLRFKGTSLGLISQKTVAFYD